jgi:hypothetical protein
MQNEKMVRCINQTDYSPRNSIPFRDNWKFLLLPGLFMALSSVLMVYSAFPERTSPQTQAIYFNVWISFIYC